MPKPVCVKCQRFYRPLRNGIEVLEQMPETGTVPPGTEAAHLWRPYKLWRADKWHCEGCGHELVTGFGRYNYAEHYEPDFAANLAAAKKTEHFVIVNDC